ncbi:MAG TPA: transcriptional regulator [Thermoflexia bacterium]|nr:transcriptional regulator [Thermoflexia bacterium]
MIHQPTRLRIMAALVALDEGDRVEFTFLQNLLGLTPGNLSIHLQKLEEAGYVVVEKGFVRRRPKTWVAATPEGREAFAAHVDALEAILRQARGAAEEEEGR